MNHGLPWGASPIDLAEEEPGEVKFLNEAGEDMAPDPELESARDPAMGAMERMAAWGLPDISAGLGWAFGVLVVSTAALLAFNSHALANWADQLPVSPMNEPVVNLADDWHAEAGRRGMNTVVDHVEQGAAAMRKAPWPEAVSGPVQR